MLLLLFQGAKKQKTRKLTGKKRVNSKRVGHEEIHRLSLLLLLLFLLLQKGEGIKDRKMNSTIV